MYTESHISTNDNMILDLQNNIDIGEHEKLYKQEDVKYDPEYDDENNIPVSKKEVLDGGDDRLYDNDELDYDWASNQEDEILFLDKLNNGQSSSDEQCWLFQPEYNDNVDTILSVMRNTSIN